MYGVGGVARCIDVDGDMEMTYGVFFLPSDPLNIVVALIEFILVVFWQINFDH